MDRVPVPALELRGLTKRYDDGTLALEGFDLTEGDEVEITISEIGTLRNPVRRAPGDRR